MKMKGFLLFLSVLLTSVASHSASADEVIYINGVIVSTNCSSVTTSSGTTGAPGMGTINWYNKSIRCNGTTIATQSGYTSEYGGNSCTIRLANSIGYSLTGRSCNNATITASTSAPVLVYSNGSVASSSCSITTTSSGTTGAPGMGTIWWYERSFRCNGAHVARLSGYSSEYGGSDCSIYLQNSSYTITGNKCSNAKIYD